MASDAPAAAGPSTAPAAPKKTTSKNSAAQFLSEDDGVRIRIHNLPVDVTDEQLLQLFGPFGSINHVYVVLDNSSRPLAAYISYAEAASATAAMEHFDGKVQLEGAPMELYITPAQDSDCDRMGLPHLEYSRLYYHGFPADSAFQDLLPTFQRFGRVCSLVMSTGVRGTVTMGTKEQAVAVIEGLDNTPVEGGKLRVHWAEMKVQGVSRPPGAKSTKGCINNCTIRYSGVPRAVPPTDIATVFGRYGPVLRVSPHLELDVPGVKDSTDRCGLVVMATEEGAKEAVAALNTHFIWPGATGPLLVARLAAPPPAPAGSSGAASSSKAGSGSGTSSAGGSVVQVVKRPVPPPGAPPPANKGPGAGRGGPGGPPPYANGHGPANGHGYPPYGAPGGGYYGGAPYGGGYYGPYGGPPHMMGPQGYGPRPPPYGPWPSVPPPGAPYGGYPSGRGPMPPPPPGGGWRNGYGGPPEGGSGMGGPVTYVVDAATGQQKPAYQLADGRLLIAPTGAVTVPPPPGGTPPPPPPPVPPAGPSPPPPQPPSQPPPPPSQPAASAPPPAQQQPAPPPPPSPPKPAPAAPVVSAPQAPEQQPPAQPQPAVVQQQAQVVQQQQPQQQQAAPAMQQQQQVHTPQQTVVQPQQQQQQAPVVQQQQLQQPQQLQQVAPAAPAVLSGSQGGAAPPGDVTGTLFTARPHTASALQPHAHALAQPVQQTGSPIHHQQHAGQQQQVLAAAAPPQQAALGLHAVASTGGYMIHSAGMAVAGLQQPLTLSMAPGGGTYMTYDTLQGHQAVQQHQQQQPLRYLTAMGGDTLSYAVAGGPPGLGVPTATTSMAVAFGHGAGGLAEQQLGAGAMYAGDSLGHVYVLT